MLFEVVADDDKEDEVAAALSSADRDALCWFIVVAEGDGNGDDEGAAESVPPSFAAIDPIPAAAIEGASS